MLCFFFLFFLLGNCRCPCKSLYDETYAFVFSNRDFAFVFSKDVRWLLLRLIIFFRHVEGILMCRQGRINCWYCRIATIFLIHKSVWRCGRISRDAWWQTVGFTSCHSHILICVSKGFLLFGWLMRIVLSFMIILFIVFNTYVYSRILVWVFWIIEF